jgi:peroxiredoxin Q/BCP
MAKIEVGQKAPDFALYDTKGNEVRLTDYQGKKNVVLFFFPKAFTGTCERMVSEHHHRYDRFQELGAEVLAVSTDQSPSQAAFLAKCGADSFPVLSDFRHQVVNLYGVAETTGPRANQRATFIVDKAGIVRHVFVEPDAGKWAGLDPEFDTLQRIR